MDISAIDQDAIAGFIGLFGELLGTGAAIPDFGEARRQDSEWLDNLVHVIIQNTKNPAFKERLSSLDSEIQEVFEIIAALAPDPETADTFEWMEGVAVVSSIIDAIAEARLGPTQLAVVEAAPARFEVEEYTEYFVKQAISKYDAEGLDATVAYYNAPESVDGQWYVYIYDPNEMEMLAHAANPDLIGRPASASVGPNNFPAGELVLALADEDGEWSSYTYTNPATGTVESKHSWSVVYDGLIFGSGWYEPGPSKSDNPTYTQAFVRQAINLYNAVGLDRTVAYYNTPESVDGQWYIFIFDHDDALLTHAPNPDLVGRPASEVVGPNNYPTSEAVVEAADVDGEWFSYTFTNPATQGVEAKHSWIVKHDGLVFGSGWYEPGPNKSDNPAYTQAFVERAINLYNAVGREDTVAYYKTKESVDGQWYVFIIDEDGYTISHHNPMFLGRDPALRIDSTGRFYGDDLLSATDAGRWVDYVLLNPETGDERQKHTWAVRHDGLIFASGWYE